MPPPPPRRSMLHLAAPPPSPNRRGAPSSAPVPSSPHRRHLSVFPAPPPPRHHKPRRSPRCEPPRVSLGRRDAPGLADPGSVYLRALPEKSIPCIAPFEVIDTDSTLAYHDGEVIAAATSPLRGTGNRCPSREGGSKGSTNPGPMMRRCPNHLSLLPLSPPGFSICPRCTPCQGVYQKGIQHGLRRRR
jgi:hypothetical protein